MAELTEREQILLRWAVFNIEVLRVRLREAGSQRAAGGSPPKAVSR